MKELGILLGRVVQNEELSSVEEAETIRKKSLKFNTELVVSREIPFPDRTTDRFKHFLDKLSDVNSSPVYVWTPRTISCGTLLVPSLREIRNAFSFAINQEGILVFLTSDLCDRLLLDFWVSDSNEECLKIEIQGKHWRDIVY